MTTSIFTIMEGLTVTPEDYEEAELFVEQYLSSAFPTTDFRQGTGLRDLTVRPNATLIALVNKAIEFYFDQSDVRTITNDTDNTLVDNKLSNYFVTRKTGTRAVINARLYFSFPSNVPVNLIIPVSAFFSPDNTIMYFPRGNISVLYTTGARDPGNFYFTFDGSANMWYVDIELEASNTSTDANLETGDLLYFTTFSANFMRASIQHLVSTAVDTETNLEMVGRAYSAISTRNLINTPSIIARINDSFNFVREVLPVGLGHPWLYRDIISITDVDDSNVTRDYHRGGHVDVYVSTAFDTQLAQLVAEEDREIPGEVAFYINGPVYEITRATSPPATASGDTIPVLTNGVNTVFNYSTTNVSAYNSESVPATPESDLGLSADQITKIKFTGTYNIGDTASFNFSVFTNIGSIDDTLHSTNERVVCADYLTRAFEPVFIDVIVDVRTTIPTNQDAIFNAMNTYVSGVPAGGVLYMTNLVSSITSNGLTDFTMPLDVSLVTYSRRTEGSSTGPSNTTTVSLVDDSDILPIQKHYLRSITYIP